MRIMLKLACGVLAALSAPALAFAANPGCHLQQVADLKIRFENNRALTDVEINGHKAVMLLDTGSQRTVFYSDAVAAMGVTLLTSDQYSYGVGGRRMVRPVHLNTFGVGGYTAKGLDLTAIDRDPTDEPEISGLIGQDFFSQLETEFDLPHGAVRLHKAVDCPTGQSLAYWTQTPGVTPLTGSIPSFEVEVKLNGHALYADLDSGAQTSIVTSQAAALTGGAQAVKGGAFKTGGIGKSAVETRIVTFDSFALADETIHHSNLMVGDFFGMNTTQATGTHLQVDAVDPTDMLLGADFLRSHRVLISNSQRRLYFTYEGGPVFQTVAPVKTAASSDAKP